MAKFFSKLEEKHLNFIGRQKVFFVASADSKGVCNLSPKGIRPLKVLGPNRTAILDYHGSGNRTAEDITAGRPVTVMFCSFEEEPMILRLYCPNGRVIGPGDPDFGKTLELWNGSGPEPGIRQIFLLDIETVQESCGYGVPLYEYLAERPDAKKLSG